MREYRIRIYKPDGDLRETFLIHAPDDATAKEEAEKRYEQLARDLAAQRDPKIVDPQLGGYTLQNDAGHFIHMRPG